MKFSRFSEGQRLTVDNSQQQRDFPKLKALIDGKFDICAKLIQLRREGQTITEKELLQGKTEMDELRQMIAKMVQREERLMLQRSSKTEEFVRYTPLMVVLAALLGVGLSVWFYFRLLRDIDQREQLSEQLREINEQTQQSIEEISKVAKKIAEGDYAARIPTTKPDNDPGAEDAQVPS